jgi:hypothetical protein
MCAQTSPPAQPATLTPAPEQAPAGQAAPTSESSGSPLDHFKEFSAIMTGAPVPGQDDEVHIYRSGDLIRMEANEGNSYQITDLAKQETHGQAKTGCLKYKNPYVRSYPFSVMTPEKKYERVPVGKETVDGHVCQVEDVTISSPKLPNPIKIRLWEAEDLQGFPIKIQTMMHRIIEYKNVVLGPQDPTLFIFPNECQVIHGTTTLKTAPPGSKPTPNPKKAPAAKPQ